MLIFAGHALLVFIPVQEATGAAYVYWSSGHVYTTVHRPWDSGQLRWMARWRECPGDPPCSEVPLRCLHRSLLLFHSLCKTGEAVPSVEGKGCDCRSSDYLVGAFLHVLPTASSLSRFAARVSAAWRLHCVCISACACRKISDQPAVTTNLSL
jgi:hypothetical protein